jgi:transposase InsO family protein
MHANARLTERVRVELVSAVTAGMSPTAAAAAFRVSRTTVYRWLRRAAAGGDGWWRDRSSAPRRSPNRISAADEAEILRLRRTWGLSPIRIAGTVGVAASTVWRVLKAAGINRTPPTPTQVQRRYERACCGDLIHVDTKRGGYIPDGGGRFVRGVEGYRTQARRRVHTGHVWFHAAVDDHSRLAYVEVLDGRTDVDTSGFITRAVAWFADRGIVVRQVMTDNAFEYAQSKRFQQALGDIDHLLIRPYRPQTNGKVERFFRTLKDEWLYATSYRSETQRRQALTRYLHYYNHHRPHTAINNQPPIMRVTNLPEQHR